MDTTSNQAKSLKERKMKERKKSTSFITQREQQSASIDEIVGIYESAGINPSQLQRFKQIFMKYDEKESGIIGLTEFKAMMEDLGESKNNAELRIMMKEADPTGNGKQLHFKDFLGIMCRIHKNPDLQQLQLSSPRKKTAKSIAIWKKAGSFLGFGKAKAQNKKKEAEIAEATGLDPVYVSSVLRRIFGPIRERTGKQEMTQEEFIKIFQDRLGPEIITKRYFKLFDTDGVGSLTPQKFLAGLKILERGTMEERLWRVFKAYDDDESDVLEFNEVQALIDQIELMLSRQRTENDISKLIIEKLWSKFDQDNGVAWKEFLAIGAEMPEFVEILLPHPLLNLQDWTRVFQMATILEADTLNEDTISLFHLLSQKGETDVYSKAKKLLDEGEIDLTATDSHQNTLLHYTVLKNDIDLIKLFLERSVPINQQYKSGTAVIHVAAEKGYQEVLNFLLDKGADINIRDNAGWTALHRALKAEREEVGGGINKSIIDLITRGADIKLLDKDQCSIIDIASRYGQSEHLDLLVKSGADVNHRSKQNYTPLHWASNGGFSNCIKKLISLGADVNARTSSGKTSLHLAAAAGSLNCVERLIQEGVDVLAQDNLLRTALHLAGESGDKRCIQLLIKTNPEALKMRDYQGNSPYEYASRLGKDEAAKIIADGPIQEQSEFSKKLLSLFRKGDHKAVEQLLKQPEADIYAANENGTTLLHYCAMQGQTHLLQSLLEKGCNPNVATFNRRTTPIHKAVQRGELQCLKLLILHGADINIQDDDDVTPIHRGLNEINNLSKINPNRKATKKFMKQMPIGMRLRKGSEAPQYGSIENLKEAGNSQANSPGTLSPEEKIQRITNCIVELLNRKVKLNLSDKAGLFPLDLVAKYGLKDFVEKFVNAGGDVEHMSKIGYKPIHYAAANGHIEIITKLESLGASINLSPKDYPEGTEESTIIHPLFVATVFQQEYSVETLIRLGADVDYVDHAGQTTLHVAAKNASTRIFEILLEKSKKHISKKDNQGNTPLHYAGNEEIIQLILENGQNVNDKNNNGDTPLLTSIAYHGKKELIEVLIQYGADLNSQNNRGVNALDVASFFGLTDCIKTLVANGMEFNEQDTNDLQFLEYRDEYVFPRVRAASAYGLINHLCNRRYADEVFRKAFFMNYREHFSSLEMFNQLTAMYERDPQVKEPPVTVDYGDLDIADFPGVLSALKFWVSNQFKDFENDELSQRFENWIEKLPEKEKKSLKITYNEKMEFSQESRFPESFGRVFSMEKVDITQIPAELFAENMTYIEHQTFKSIQYKELLNQSWCHKDAIDEAPNVVGMVRRFNQVSCWVVKEILSYENKQARVKVMQKIIAIGKACYDLNNFQSAMQIISGLESSPISRLNRTKQELGKYAAILSDMKTKFGFERNNREYRQMLSVINEPCIPFIGISLQDLTFLEEGNLDTIDVNGKELINFEKHCMTSQIIDNLLRFQQYPYKLQPNLPLIRFMQYLPFMNERDAFQRSLEIEPRAKSKGQ